MLGAIDRNAEKWALLVFYTMLVVTMAVEVLRREIFSYSSIWGEEIVRYSFIYLAWIGAAAAVKERAHIRIDVIFNYVPPRVKSLLYIFGDLVMLIIAVFSLWLSFEKVGVSWEFGSVTHGLRVDKVWFLMAVPIGFTLMIFRLVQSLLRDLKDFRDGTPVYEGAKLFD
ncbi:TRAP transporter small permease [Pontivivens insulae]|uniref:TRAP transporter small permease protein n=1 Tax=Pontivivens insulae TaxID=1639689 RepID=A0A2R8A7W8_9RHOB|nr:TRAP transporter small permease [Pontivivens insulae]RED18388.1 TRAP-type C4-dicarboxylate transport system permease small subunit [Pontivivens insulae]SPF28286.1 Sialic acid TRAP transporter permease protein SiaT [Pontivivens insulae]